MIKTQIYLPLSTQNSHINEITNPRSFFDQHSATPYTHLARSRSSDLTHRTSCTQSASNTPFQARTPTPHSSRDQYHCTGADKWDKT